ncbi:MAG: alpha-N-arabinofuranosidase [Prevotella sp.]|nr:alpha-N-arabinofuranosidase [Prevotella sp.]
MKNLITSLLLSAACTLPAMGQDATATIHVNQGTNRIPKEIYGQFAEHLGTCIYGGLWVGPESSIPNTQGYRNDVLQALKDLKVPVLRWPGGCFADEYHWMDGIGPRDKRPKMQNNNWGGTIEDNSFGTHEFLNLCELLGAEPYISGNVGSGTVEELAKWVEYMTSDGETPMAKLRRQNGREKSWNVKYLGVGNESWGCGGNMRPEYYADLYRRYSVYCRNYDNHKLYKIASGASDYDYNWTKVLMDNVGDRMNGLSLHYYTVKGWNGSKGASSKFDNQEYYWTIGKCLQIEDVIKKHCDIMDQKDPQKKVALLVDEWGTWWDEEPGTIPGHLYQQNTMRDAMVAALSLNVFQRHTDRIKMANIAQIVNVLQSMILTDTKGTGHMVLTPTYYVFQMYRDFQDATYLPMDVKTDSITVEGGHMYRMVDGKIPAVSVSAAKKDDGAVVVALANTSLDKQQTVELSLDGATAKTATGRILTSKKIDDYNDFDHPEVIKTTDFKDIKLKKNSVRVTLPAKSIVVINLR